VGPVVDVVGGADGGFDVEGGVDADGGVDVEVVGDVSVVEAEIVGAAPLAASAASAELAPPPPPHEARRKIVAPALDTRRKEPRKDETFVKTVSPRCQTTCRLTDLN
jgi:hypothetical protein